MNRRPAQPCTWDSWSIKPDQAQILQRLVRERNPQTAVEIGSLFGHSAVAICQALSPGARLYCVDPWLHDPRTDQPELNFPPNVFKHFLAQVAEAGFAEVVTPIRAHGSEAWECYDLQPDLVFIDSGHGFEQTLLEILLWERPSALLCGHDYSWLPVGRAVHTASAKLGRPYHAEGEIWWMPPMEPAGVDPAA